VVHRDKKLQSSRCRHPGWHHKGGMTRHRRRPDGLAANVKARPNSNKAHLALRARYRGGELTVEAREHTAIVAVVVLLVVFATAAMVVAVRAIRVSTVVPSSGHSAVAAVDGVREVDQALDRGRAVLAAELGQDHQVRGPRSNGSGVYGRRSNLRA
jgi:hypothetical protein